MASLIKRGNIYYAQVYVGGKQRRYSLETDSLQIAKEKLRRMESSLARDEGLGLPTRTPIAEVVEAYVAHIRTTKTLKSAQTDVYYLREAFGAICPASSGADSLSPSVAFQASCLAAAACIGCLVNISSVLMHRRSLS